MTVSCSWCHEMNDLSVSNVCANCGHRADLSRMGESAVGVRTPADPEPK
jgi:hypothetical protein